MDRAGQIFDVCNVLDTDASQNNACRTKDVRFQNSLTRPTQQLRILRYHRNGETAALDSCVCVCEG